MSAPEASFHVLDSEKAARMNAKTLYIPSVLDVAGAIAAISKGETRTITDLCNELAALGNAETACPAKTIKYWKRLACAACEIKDPASPNAVPRWRVLNNGRISRHLPGDVERQAALLKEEGGDVGV